MKPEISDRENRCFAASVELRAANEGESSKKVFGYAAKFNSRSENLGSAERPIFETIMPGAFDDVLNDDVRALVNHDPSAILARSKNGSGTLTLGADNVGLWYEFEAPDTQIGRDLVTSLKRGDVDQSSFSFTLSKEGQEWRSERTPEGADIMTRTITKVARLFDVSPVTYPGYSDATVALRSLEHFQAEQVTEETPEPIDLTIPIRYWQRVADSK